jgi:tetratricopeptide (TPR) repeat protein
LARLANSAAASSSDGLYVQGLAWAKKAETAPLPTPEALPPGSPRGAVPVAPEFKPEELRAIEFYEKASAAAPQAGQPALALARLIAPHAQRRHEATLAAKKPVRGRHADPAPPIPQGMDASPARVARAYRDGITARPTDKDAVQELYNFAVKTDLLEDAGWALEQAIARDKENGDPLVQYGDFLVQVKKTPDAAIATYRQALIWKPDDKTIKNKIADIYLGVGSAHYQQNELALAEASYREALKWADPGSDVYRHIQAEIDRLKRVRG